MKQDLKLDSKIVIENTEYIIKDKIILDKEIYYLLKNDKSIYLIRKTNSLKLLSSTEELKKIYNIFGQRNAF